jgi:hypothetical protein
MEVAPPEEVAAAEAPAGPHPVWIAAGLVVVAILLTAWRFRLGLEANDDVAMMRLASGVVSGEPSPHLVYVHHLLGVLAATGFSVLPTVNVYGWLLLGGMALAFGVFAWLFVHHLGPWRGAVAFVAVYVLVWLDVVYRAQFTHAAVWLGAAGAVLAAHTMLGARPPSRRALVVAAAFVFVAGLVRWKAAALGVAITMPLLLVAVWRSRRWRPAAALLAGLVAAQLLWLGDEAVLRRDAGWAEYLDWNQARASLFDVERRAGELPHVPYAEVGFDRYDVRAIGAYLMLDREVFSAERLRRLREMADERPGRVRPAKNRTRERWAVTDKRGVIACVALLLLLAHGRRRELAAFIGLHAILMISATLYLAWFGKFVDRSFKPLWFGFIALGVTWYALRAKTPPAVAGVSAAGRRRRAWGVAVAAVLVAALLWAGGPRLKRARRLSAEANVRWERWSTWLANERELRPERIIVDLQLGHWRTTPLLVDPRSLGDDHLVAAGWALHSPTGQAQLERLGIEDLQTAIVHDERVFVLPGIGHPKLLQLHHRKWRDEDIRYAPAPKRNGKRLLRFGLPAAPAARSVPGKEVIRAPDGRDDTGER